MKKLNQKVIPFGKANPRRGQRYAAAKTAEELLKVFPLNSETDSVTLKKWGQNREEFTIKIRRDINRIVSALRSIGTSKYTPAPFWIENIGPNRWRVEPSKQTIVHFDITTGVKQMAESRKQRLRHLIESIRPDDHTQRERDLMGLIWDQEDQFAALILNDIEIWNESFEKQIKRLQSDGAGEYRQLG